MIDGAPEVVGFTANPNEDLIQMPALPDLVPASRDAPIPNLGGEDRSKPVPPGAHGFMTDVDTTLVEQILNLTERQWEADAQQHSEPNDCR